MSSLKEATMSHSPLYSQRPMVPAIQSVFKMVDGWTVVGWVDGGWMNKAGNLTGAQEKACLIRWATSEICAET